jgi:imidazolonepropionase
LKVSGADMAFYPHKKNAYLFIENGLIADFGSMEELPEIIISKTIDATGK